MARQRVMAATIDQKIIIPPDSMLWDVKTAMANLGMTRYTLMRLATDAEAVVKIGTRTYLSTGKLRKYIDAIAV